MGILTWYRLSLSCGLCCCSYGKHLLGSHCVIFFTLPFSGCSYLICTPELYPPTNINYAHTLCPPSVFMKYKFASSLCSEASLYAKKRLAYERDIKLAPFRPDSRCCIPLCFKLSLICKQRLKTWIWVFRGSALITGGMGVASPCASQNAHKPQLPGVRGDESVSTGVLPTLRCHPGIRAAQLHQGLASLWFPGSKT